VRANTVTVLSRKTGEQRLAERVHSTHLRLRLGIERQRERKIFGQGRSFFHIENWASMRFFIGAVLRMTMMAERGRRNARRFQVTHNPIYIKGLPQAFDGFTLLQLSDLHLDSDPDFPSALSAAVHELEYDLCVLTGDFRFQTYGPWRPAIDALRRVSTYLSQPVYAVLGNHDSIEMVPEMEDLGIRVLLNESVRIERDGARFHLAGIDDPHYFCTDNFERACETIPPHEISLLLAHSPEIFRQAAHAGFDVMFCGHTHGGQIRLPGGKPIICNARCPRVFCAGSWQYLQLQGYTSLGTGSSIVPARFNCPPDITLHRLHCG